MFDLFWICLICWICLIRLFYWHGGEALYEFQCYRARAWRSRFKHILCRARYLRQHRSVRVPSSRAQNRAITPLRPKKILPVCESETVATSKGIPRDEVLIPDQKWFCGTGFMDASWDAFGTITVHIGELWLGDGSVKLFCARRRANHL